MSEHRGLAPVFPTLLAFKGPDATRYLNGQITQSADGLGQRSLPACVTDAKGKLQYFVDITTGPDEQELWVSCPKKHSDGLLERLERYLIADDVEIVDLTGRWNVTHINVPLPGATLVREKSGVFGRGFDHWSEEDPLKAGSTLTEEESEYLRTLSGLPAWGKELKTGMLPPEAGLDKTAISYGKGCYIGQEVPSRIKSAKKTNRRLAKLQLSQWVAPQEPLMFEGKEVGQLTSVAANPSEKTAIVALGYIKKIAFDHTTFQTAAGAEVTVTGWA